jgi:hypothetical protein
MDEPLITATARHGLAVVLIFPKGRLCRLSGRYSWKIPLYLFGGGLLQNGREPERWKGCMGVHPAQASISCCAVFHIVEWSLTVLNRL